MSDEDLQDQRSVLLAHKVASEEARQGEVEQAEMEQEHQAARLHEYDRIAKDHMEQFQRDQEILRDIKNDKAKV